MNIHVFAGEVPGGSPGSHVVHDGVNDIEEFFRLLGLEYTRADYLSTRRVVIVLDPNPGTDPRDEQIERLRSALLASGVKEGLVDAIQVGTVGGINA